MTETEEETQEQFDIEKVDISWFTNRVKVGDVVIKGDSIGFLREEYRLHRALPLIAVDSKGFQTGCYWVYAVLPADRDLLLEYLQLKEDTFKNNQSKAGIYSRESSLGYKLLQADADMTDEIATSQEAAKWNNNIPEKGVLCWVSDDFVADSSCEAMVILGYEIGYTYKYRTQSTGYKYAVPLTEKEVRALYIPKATTLLF